MDASHSLTGSSLSPIRLLHTAAQDQTVMVLVCAAGDLITRHDGTMADWQSRMMGLGCRSTLTIGLRTASSRSSCESVLARGG